jgi:hypothetical protein
MAIWLGTVFGLRDDARDRRGDEAFVPFTAVECACALAGIP